MHDVIFKFAQKGINTKKMNKTSDKSYVASTLYNNENSLNFSYMAFYQRYESKFQPLNLSAQISIRS